MTKPSNLENVVPTSADAAPQVDHNRGLERRAETLSTIATERRSDTQGMLERPMSNRLAQELAGMATITPVESPEDPTLEVFTINVTDPEKFNSRENHERMFTLFGPMLYRTYYPEVTHVPKFDAWEDHEEEDFGSTDIGSADEITVAAKNDKVRSLVMMKKGEPLPSGQKTALLLVSAARGKSKAKIAEDMVNRTLSKNYKDTVVFAGTHEHPALVSALNIANREDPSHRFFFRGRANGDKDIPVSQEDVATLAEVKAQFTKMLSPGGSFYIEESDQTDTTVNDVDYGRYGIHWNFNIHKVDGDQYPAANETYNELREHVRATGKKKHGYYGMTVWLPNEKK
ncbi:MAG: hypothetical protein WCG83_00275 [Candidatus Peregrinibacteria bacterium]